MAATSNLTYKNELITSSIGKNTNIHPQNLKTADTTLTIPKNKSGKKKTHFFSRFFFPKNKSRKNKSGKNKSEKKKPTKEVKFRETANVAKIKQSLNSDTDQHQECILLKVRKIHGAELNESELIKLENCEKDYPTLATNITTINREQEAENINKKYPYDVQEYHKVAKHYTKNLMGQDEYSNKQYSELTYNERMKVQDDYNTTSKHTRSIKSTYEDTFTLNNMIDVYNYYQKQKQKSYKKKKKKGQILMNYHQMN